MMQPPFTTEQFLDVFHAYNEAVWPLQFAFVALAVATVVVVVRGRWHSSRRFAGAVLAFFWLWMGVVYHFLFFKAINPLAPAFGILFIVQALLVVWLGVISPSIRYAPDSRWNAVAGWVLATYALVAYPMIAEMSGQHYPALPTFGLPCPTTIFTIAILLWMPGTSARALLVIPILWSILGLSAATALGIREDFGLTVAGAIAVLRMLQPAKRFRRTATT